MDARIRRGATVTSIDEVPLGEVDEAPFEGPGGARFFTMRTRGGIRLLVPAAALVDEGEGTRVSLPARDVGRLPVREAGAVAPEQARQALEALGARQGFVFDEVAALLPDEPLDP